MSQPGINSETRELAEQLVALEARSHSVSKTYSLATCRVCEKLRRPLITLTGTAGYSSLLARALTLASREAPALSTVHVQPDGSLEGLEGHAVQAHVVLVGYLLSLLITFIGETLTLRLLHDVWPDLPEPVPNSLGRNRNEPEQQSKDQPA